MIRQAERVTSEVKVQTARSDRSRSGTEACFGGLLGSKRPLAEGHGEGDCLQQVAPQLHIDLSQKGGNKTNSISNGCVRKAHPSEQINCGIN